MGTATRIEAQATLETAVDTVEVQRTIMGFRVPLSVLAATLSISISSTRISGRTTVEMPLRKGLLLNPGWGKVRSSQRRDLKGKIYR